MNAPRQGRSDAESRIKMEFREFFEDMVGVMGLYKAGSQGIYQSRLAELETKFDALVAAKVANIVALKEATTTNPNDEEVTEVKQDATTSRSGVGTLPLYRY